MKTELKQYMVVYHGNAKKYLGFSEMVLATSERDAAERVYSLLLNMDYFPDGSGFIYDCDGNEIATPEDNVIEYDGGYFRAHLYSGEEGHFLLRVYDAAMDTELQIIRSTIQKLTDEDDKQLMGMIESYILTRRLAVREIYKKEINEKRNG